MNIYKFIIVLLLLFSGTLTYGATFKIEPLSDQAKNQMKEFKIYKDECPVPLERLRTIKFGYYDFSGKENIDGQMVIIDAAAHRVLKIFKALHASKFPLSSSHPIEYYKGNDEDSMNDNNSSSFNCRVITGGGLISIHSYGLAIDLNPIENPYLNLRESIKILPEKGKKFINRANLKPGMVESTKAIFKKNGFSVWGGSWDDEAVIDWQHFQTPRPVAQLLAAMSPTDASDFFELYVKAEDNTIFEPVKEPNDKIVALYHDAPDHFMKTFKMHKKIFSMSPNQVYSLLAMP